MGQTAKGVAENSGLNKNLRFKTRLKTGVQSRAQAFGVLNEKSLDNLRLWLQSDNIKTKNSFEYADNLRYHFKSWVSLSGYPHLGTPSLDTPSLDTSGPGTPFKTCY